MNRASSPLPLVKDVVLVGGGHAHALFLRRWAMKPVKGARVTVINPAATAPYTGMLPGYVAGHYRRDELDIDLVKLCRFAGASLVIGRAIAIDRAAKQVTVKGSNDETRTLPFDVAAIDVGITSAMPQIPGFFDNAIAAKPLDRFADRWDVFLETAPLSPKVTVIGGGVGGVELALAMAHRLRTTARTPTVRVVDQGRVLQETSQAARDKLRRLAEDAGISFLEKTQIEAVGPDSITLSSGEKMASDLTVGAAGAKAHPWLAEIGLSLRDGFIKVGPTLQSETDPAIFASGDCAHLSHAPRPKAGVFAVRAAPYLYKNIRAKLSSYPLKEFVPQTDYLKLISLGDKAALMDKWAISVHGPWLWQLKDRIDRAFMDKLKELPKPDPIEFPTEPYADGMREEIGGGRPACAGCGAKVGAQALQDALDDIAPTREDVITGPGDDAAVLKMGNQHQVITTDHLRGFTEDPWLMGAVAANHALSDVLAMGAAPQVMVANLTLPPMSPPLQTRTIRSILDGARQSLKGTGADIVGGHTTTGNELTVGFTVTGLRGARPVSLSGAQAGDDLILTKPIGTGVILAAEMRLEGEGHWVAGCYRSMLQSSLLASDILATANAMTDVTGFGLAGHALAMMRASDTRARLDLGTIPVLDGAEALADRGIRSSLYAANRADASDANVPEAPKADLLFDPQTSGGLLAAVSPGDAEMLVNRLQESGYRAARIGTVEAYEEGFRLECG